MLLKNTILKGTNLSWKRLTYLLPKRNGYLEDILERTRYEVHHTFEGDKDMKKRKIFQIDIMLRIMMEETVNYKTIVGIILKENNLNKRSGKRERGSGNIRGESIGMAMTGQGSCYFNV
jgi:hypothetical protein